jgi:hypothetical protein
MEPGFGPAVRNRLSHPFRFSSASGGCPQPRPRQAAPSPFVDPDAQAGERFVFSGKSGIFCCLRRAAGRQVERTPKNAARLAPSPYSPKQQRGRG